MRYILFIILLLSNLLSVSQSSDKQLILLNADYAAVQNKLYKIANAASSFDVKQKESFNQLEIFINKHPASQNALHLLADANNLTYNQFDSLLKLLDTSLARAPFRSNVEVTKRRISTTETGKLFPELNLADTLGNITSIKSYTGKFVLIDFWSSWCGPCRKQIPDLIKAHKKYKDRLTIIGVSMDADKQKWLEAIKTDKQPWIQFCELVNFSENKTARTFSIYGIPANYLINEAGIIVGQDLSPEQVARYLANN